MINYMREIVKSNDNKQNKPSVVLTNNFGNDALELARKRWKLSDEAYYKWASSISAASHSVMATLISHARNEHTHINSVDAVHTAQALAILNTFYAMIKNLNPDERAFILQELDRRYGEMNTFKKTDTDF